MHLSVFALTWAKEQDCQIVPRLYLVELLAQLWARSGGGVRMGGMKRGFCGLFIYVILWSIDLRTRTYAQCRRNGVHTIWHSRGQERQGIEGTCGLFCRPNVAWLAFESMPNAKEFLLLLKFWHSYRRGHEREGTLRLVLPSYCGLIGLQMHGVTHLNSAKWQDCAIVREWTRGTLVCTEVCTVQEHCPRHCRSVVELSSNCGRNTFAIVLS